MTPDNPSTSGPKVSIVTPSFNQGRYLAATIQSVCDQTYGDVEHIVIDGGSTDESRAILERYDGQLAYWQSQPDGGFSDALDQGFRRARGEILAYLNSDDLLAPNAVAEAVHFLEQHRDVVLVYGNRLCIDVDGSLLYARPGFPVGAHSRYNYIFIGQESCFWRRSAFEQVGGIDTALSFAVDYDLFSRLGRVGKIAHCGSIWGSFRRHDQSKTMSAFATVGRREVAHIQQKVWGEATPRWRHEVVQLGFRLYATTYDCALRVIAPKVALPRRAPLSKRIRSVFHNQHWLARAIDRFGGG